MQERTVLKHCTQTQIDVKVILWQHWRCTWIEFHQEGELVGVGLCGGRFPWRPQILVGDGALSLVLGLDHVRVLTLQLEHQHAWNTKTEYNIIHHRCNYVSTNWYDASKKVTLHIQSYFSFDKWKSLHDDLKRILLTTQLTTKHPTLKNKGPKSQDQQHQKLNSI